MNPLNKKSAQVKGVQPPLVRPGGNAHQFKPTVAQPKNAAGSQLTRGSIAPPVYKPLPQPKVLQTKKAQTAAAPSSQPHQSARSAAIFKAHGLRPRPQAVAPARAGVQNLTAPRSGNIAQRSVKVAPPALAERVRKVSVSNLPSNIISPQTVVQRKRGFIKSLSSSHAVIQRAERKGGKGKGKKEKKSEKIKIGKLVFDVDEYHHEVKPAIMKAIKKKGLNLGALLNIKDASNADFFIESDGTILVGDNGTGGKGGVNTGINYYDLFPSERPQQTVLAQNRNYDLPSDDSDEYG